VFSSQPHSVSHPLVSDETKLHQAEKFEREEIARRGKIRCNIEPKKKPGHAGLF
jgi:hypothetical protein